MDEGKVQFDETQLRKYETKNLINRYYCGSNPFTDANEQKPKISGKFKESLSY